jgi:pyridine nucleotide-disulfide oxidoreductase family protein
VSDKQTLLLVGGGHAHVEVLRRLADAPIPNVDIALFDPSPSVWYSGMLPGVIAGHYEPSQAKVNLWALCQKARVRFIESSIVNVDAAMQRVYTAASERHFYDVLSLDIGSVSRDLPTAPGAYVVPVKPIDRLLTALNERDAIRSSGLAVQVIGGGAAAVEVALALAHRWRASPEKKIGLISATKLLDAFPAKARDAALAHCASARVSVLESTLVKMIEPTRLLPENGEAIASQITVLATGYSPAPLLESIDVQKTDDGSIAVNSGLQSRSHKNVFAAGDCSGNPKVAIAKSGVFAVRQGPVLYENLRLALKGGSLQSYEHDAKALALISLGGKRAIATRNGFTLVGGWTWAWKDRIDRKWIAKYS